MPDSDCTSPGDSARVPPAVPRAAGDDSIAVSRELFADVLMALAQCARRLESHARNPGVVDATVMQHAKRCMIQGSAALRLCAPAPGEA